MITSNLEALVTNAKDRITKVIALEEGGLCSCTALDVARSDRDRALIALGRQALQLHGGGESRSSLPVALHGPWHVDEMGTFNGAGWGFTVIVPDAYWGRGEDDLPPEITSLAEALEATIRAHLNRPPTPQNGVGADG